MAYDDNKKSDLKVIVISLAECYLHMHPKSADKWLDWESIWPNVYAQPVGSKTENKTHPLPTHKIK